MILITNDDGIYAPGLAAVRDELRGEEATVVAPDMEQSGAAHSITVHLPLRVRKINIKGEFLGYAVSGSPADCVKVAICELLGERPAAVLSGINYGANLGVSVLYSGTVAGALEGAMFGVPSIAFSLEYSENPLFSQAARFVRTIYHHFSEHPLPPGTLLNVNIPAIPADQIQGMKATRMSRGVYNERFEKRYDPRGGAYYWVCGDIDQSDAAEGTDIHAIANGFISITPIHYDMSDYRLLEALGGAGSPILELGP